MFVPGYYSNDEETYYVSRSGAIYLVGSLDTEGVAVWEPCEALPADATPTDFDEEFAAEVEASRRDHGIE